MIYNGTRLKQYLREHRGAYTELSHALAKYRRPRKNGGGEDYNLAPFFRYGHNITLSILTGLMKETGMPIDFFVDFEPGEVAQQKSDSVNGNNNIINSTVNNDLTQKIDHLGEIVALKDELIAAKEHIISMKDAELAEWKKRYEDLSSKFGNE